MKIHWRNRVCVLLLGLSVAVFLCGSALAAEKASFMIKAGGQTATEDDLLFLLSQQTGGNEMMTALTLAQMDQQSRMSFADQVADMMLLAQAAEAKGLELKPEVARMIRWETAQTLAQAYVDHLMKNCDLSEKAVRAYYQSHPSEFVEPEAVHARHILANSESEANSILLKVLVTGDFPGTAKAMSRDTESGEKGGDLGWVERGQTPKAFEEVLFRLSPGKIGGPVKTEFGWHLIQVVERRPERKLSFKEAFGQARQKLQRAYLNEELAKLRNQMGVQIDEKGLGNLGGLPALGEPPSGTK